ncbi:LAFA_0F21660g1_1 [Lachancea sp. 'fantastica']|nr:LAFA_0F21660g1_1 [Lachancea sp. 'fantastica']
MGNSPSKPINRNNNDPNIPPSLRFSRHRQMIISSVFSVHRRYLCFSTAHSYERFKNSGKKYGIPQNLQDEGLGVPLFEFEDPSTLTRLVNSSDGRFQISKFVFQSSSLPPPHPESTVVCQNQTHVIYKMPFCIVTRIFSGSRSGFEFTFYTSDGNLVVQTLKHHLTIELDARLGDWNVGWRRTRLEDYDLLVLPPQARSLLDPPEVSASKPGGSQSRQMYERNALVWAKYIDAGESFLPALSHKLAVLDIGEVDFETDATAYGLASIPWFSQVIACIALVQCQRIQERRRQNKKRRRRRMNR